MNMGIIDVIIFALYFVGVVFFGVIVAARSKTKSSADYFLASKKLPWYVVGASFIASNISSEHFIGMVGWGFLYGMAVANWEWGNVITFSILIWVFLPFYMRGNISTMPEWLERRFNKFCRYVYAVVQIAGLVIAMLGGVMFAGAKAINVFFPKIEIWQGILILAAAAGTYTIYGGLLSAVWADLLQYCLLMIAGIVVTIFGLYHVGGLNELMTNLPEKFIVFYPKTHEMIPWTGLFFGIFSVGIWYSCANQFMVQRCLGARSEWDARMGIVMAGFSKALLPLLVVLPGIIAFYLFQDQISDGDQSWPFLVKQFLPQGLTGLVLAGLASAILSTLSAITNSSSTIFTLDIYKTILRPIAGDRELHKVGRISSTLIMLIGVIVGLIVSCYPTITVFQLIQQVFFYIAPPIAAAFLLGILWRRITPIAASVGLVAGFVIFLPLVTFVVFPKTGFLQPYDNFMHHTFAVFVLSSLLMIIVSFFTKPKSKEELVGVIWSKSALGVAEGEKGNHKGLLSLTIWWSLMVLVIVFLYIYTNSRGSGTTWLEAENVKYDVNKGGDVRIQTRQELAKVERFNLWTGKGQVLFKPLKSDDTITFQLPVKKPGRYQIDALVTMGPDYGKFAVTVDNHDTSITYPVTQFSNGGKKYSVIHKTVPVFDAARKINNNTQEGGIAGSHVVRRISLGIFPVEKDTVTVSFIAKDVSDTNFLIGVDQLMVTFRGK